ncbi:MAG: nitroreductase family protein [Eubacteriales bacterium]|nr:nitroreductase family protein [Eubacteriales bacterium]
MNAIFKRRSIRKYTDQIIPDEMIEQLLRAGMAAPSAHNGQPWHFIVIDDRNLLNDISKFHPFSRMLKEASHAIIVCGDARLRKKEGFWVQDCSAATQNILLMACELGLGGVWLGIYPSKILVGRTRKLFEIPEGFYPLSIISLGFPAETKEPSDRFNPSRIHKNKW